MPALILIPFGVFFVCCILQFWFLKQTRDALIERHPDTFLSVEKSSIFPLQGLYKFANGSSYKDLNDTSLNRHVRNLKRLMILGYAAWGAYAISLFAMPHSAQQLPLALANGSYANECCGRLILENGMMRVRTQEVSYVIESDKEGSYVLPAFYVGAASGGYVVRRNGVPLKLRLDSQAHPAAVDLLDDTGGGMFSFRRSNGS